MKRKLESFESFCQQLYPHEVDYLLSIHKFQKSKNIRILNLIHYNAKNPENRLPFDKTIDKRIYSYMKNWIEENLNKVDVDKFFEWLIETEKLIMTDTIQSTDEILLLKRIDEIRPSSYYFMKFYRVLQHYRDYLIVRNRPRNYAIVSDYLEKYSENYTRSQQLNNIINSSAEKVIFHKTDGSSEFARWEQTFSEIYFNETIDGYTRYRAIVRLTILYYTNREFDKLKDVYQHLDMQFKKDVFYSKRILANYYANRAMVHSKLNELDLALKYGYLSIRYKNSDYLFYLVNVCNILLRQQKNKQALEIMVEAFPELKRSGNYYYKIGFVSYYIKALITNGDVKKAVDFGESYFASNKKEIFEFRWHLFFTAYIDALFHYEKYARIRSLVKRYGLHTKEKQMKGTKQYLPVIQLYYQASGYMEGAINQDMLKKIFLEYINEIGENRFRHQRIVEVLNTIGDNLPHIVKEVISNYTGQKSAS